MSKECLLIKDLSCVRRYSNQLPYDPTGEPKWVIRKGQPWPVNIADGTYPYVVLQDGELRVGAIPRPRGKIHHPELVRGEDVIAAGMICVNDRRVLRVSNESGHYRPNIECINYALIALRFWQIPLARRLIVDPVWES